MTTLVKYNAARHALAVCKNIDEVKGVLDKAEAMRAYGVMSKDETLIHDATEIRLRAERRLGEMIDQARVDGELSRGAAEKHNALDTPEGVRKPTLADAGISYDQSSRAQNIAAVPEKEFEQEIAGLRERTKRDGKQVQTRLNERGKQVRGKAPAKEVAPKPDETAELLARIGHLEEMSKVLLAENEAMGKVADADDKLAESERQNKQMREQVRVLKERNNGLLNSEAAAKKAAKTWQSKFLALEKAMKRAA